MYLEVDEGFLEHPKTLQLCATMRNPLAFGHMLHLWKWAARSCKDGDLRGMDSYAIEEAARYPQHDGQLYAALVAKLGDKPGFLDVDSEGKAVGIHNWILRTGAAIKRMEDKAKANRDRREAARVGHQVCGVPAACQNRTGTVDESSRHKSDQDKTSQDQTSQDKEKEGAPRVCAELIRPRTAHNLEHCMRVAIQREQPQAGMWIPGRFSSKEADKLLCDLGDIEAALPELERKIDLFAKDPDMQPWTVSKFADKYNAIGLPKLEFGRAPKPEAPRRSTPVKEW